ncbi:MAG: hypothetical protein H5T61_09015 [Thermoflexales bacterium]|nr:hypothetical protein [Thermoflexales bacterium]
MKTQYFLTVLVVLVLSLALSGSLVTAQGTGPQRGGAQAALGTGFTYQGQLQKDGNPVNGNCDLQFSLWDAASGGSQVGSTQSKASVSVSNGLFTIPDLDFGTGAFTGAARWLAVAVRCPAGSGMYTNLSPRQALTAAPYALGLQPGASIVGQEGNYSALTVSNGYPGGVWPPYEKKAVAAWTSDGTALWGAAGSGRGVYGASLEGTAVYGASGSGVGVYGESSGATGAGVKGYASATGGITYGVYGQSNSTAGTGVRGVATATSGATYGVLGWSLSSSGTGVYGWASAASGYTIGVWGRNDSATGAGVVGHALATSGGTHGVRGQSDSPDGRGVVGWATAASGNNIGVYGESSSTAGVGVYGRSTATSGTTAGVVGSSTSTDGVGVLGSSEGSDGIGIYGTAPDTGYAGYFLGNVHVYGGFSASGSKAFKIDHPLDPANRYLYHFAQEAPEVQNVYNGVVTLDARGEATVALPDYFSALNAGPFRYQLTAIGAPMPNLYIAQEIQGNTFRIAGGVPGKKVSWEVTAVRNDPYLHDHPAQAEVDKPADEQGTYLYPQGYGQPQEMGLDYQRHRDLLERPEAEPLPIGSGER